MAASSTVPSTLLTGVGGLLCFQDTVTKLLWILLRTCHMHGLKLSVIGGSKRLENISFDACIGFDFGLRNEASQCSVRGT